MDKPELQVTEDEFIRLFRSRATHYFQVFGADLLKLLADPGKESADTSFETTADRLIREALGGPNTEDTAADLIFSIARSAFDAALETVYHPGWPSGIHTPLDSVSINSVFPDGPLRWQDLA